MNCKWDIQQIIAAYNTPLVFHPGGWGDDFPKEWQDKVIGQRLELIDDDGWNRATDAEVAMYLSTASLVTPLGRDWAEIYIHAVGQIIPQVYDSLGRETITLNREQELELLRLKQRIRNKQKEENVDKRKIVIEEREDGVMVGISRTGVDPFVKKVAIPWEAFLDMMPFVKGVSEVANQHWEVSGTKNPIYTPPAVKSATSKKAKAVESPTKTGSEAKPETPKTETPAPVQEKLPETPATTLPEAVAEAPKLAALPAAKECQTVTLAPSGTSQEGTQEIDNSRQASTLVVDQPAPAQAPEEPVASTPAAPAPAKRTRVSADTFQYRLKDGRGPFDTVQAAMDALGLDPKTRPLHNRHDRLSKKLQEEILQEQKA